MEIESTQGPAALVNANVDKKDSDEDEDDKDDDEENTDDDVYDDDEEEEEVDSDKENNKLRAYELNRLRLILNWSDIHLMIDFIIIIICFSCAMTGKGYKIGISKLIATKACSRFVMVESP
jgi:hypothetical protein